MISGIEIRNFRCYRELKISRCSRLNVIVGDNGTGKTTLVESIFLPLASSVEVAMRLRQQRGLDGILGGAPKRIEEAVWGDLFHNQKVECPICLSLSGDGPEARALEISRTAGEAILPFTGAFEPIVTSPITFTWNDSKGRRYPVVPKFTSSGVVLPDTGEDLPDFFFFAANTTIGSVENASRFSELSKLNLHKNFVKTFTREYDWIKDLNVEVHAGAPAIFATLRGTKHKIPIPNVSSGVNRVLSVMLAIATRRNSIVLVDEIETGIYYSHLSAVWRVILSLLRINKAQMFVSTHSKECLEALVEAAGDEMDDISLWRTERNGDTFSIRQFDGEDLKAGIEYGEDVR